jgi:hypothetical protein
MLLLLLISGNLKWRANQPFFFSEKYKVVGQTYRYHVEPMCIIFSFTKEESNFKTLTFSDTLLWSGKNFGHVCQGCHPEVRYQ